MFVQLKRLACLVVTLASVFSFSVGSAGATAPSDGWGFAIADDGGPFWLTSAFERLRPKTFRFMVPWYAAGSQADRDRATAIIAAARARGVQEIVVSFNYGGLGKDYAPQPTTFANQVALFMQEFKNSVDVWGPANEPNCGGGWEALNLNGSGGTGAQLTADYYNAMQWLRAGIDPTAKLLSPDLCDSYFGNSVGSWVAAYKAAGGGFGDAIAWHPYWGTHNKSLWSTLDMMLAVGGNKPIWVTEDGGFGVNAGRGINDNASVQADKVFWMIDTLAAQPRVARVYYYQMGSSPSWDTGLLTPTGSRRPSWFLWCAASHGGNSPDCAP